MAEQRKKFDDQLDVMPFQSLQKGLVLQEKRLFNASPLNPRECCHLITKIMYLLVRGEHFTTQEAEDLFFAVTKLFQSQDMILRRMVYLVLKELSPLADSVIIIIASITKDMNSQSELYRSNAMRVLCGILTDLTMLGQGERYLKQAVVDQEPSVASAALVQGVHLMRNPANGEIVKRWTTEIQEAIKSRNVMVQYHALGLLAKIKQHDRLAVSKVVSVATRSPLRSALAHCLLIRLTTQVIIEDRGTADVRALYDYLESCLRHKSELVIFEAARSICSLPDITSRELHPAISVLQLFLASPKPTLRFAAIRTLNKVAQTYPLSVTSCNLDMENLVTDPNRSIATLAITTLLKTGSESSVERLMKQINSFMSEISDEFKIVVVEAIQGLCLKFPKKHRALMAFLSSMLRDEGGFPYKKAIVEGILTIIRYLPEAKELGLGHLCEFIEDCEFSFLSTRILHLLGEEGPTTSSPSKYIRYVYNRVILENAAVRAAAVGALAKIGLACPDLRDSITILIRRCLMDNDDEVRDRAVLYLRAMQGDSLQALAVGKPLAPPLVNLEAALQAYLSGPCDVPFDVSTVDLEPPVSEVAAAAAKAAASSSAVGGVGAAAGGASPGGASQAYEELMAKVPQLADLGRLLCSSRPVELTEADTEYDVNCVKHVFPEAVVFQYNVTNTLEDYCLDMVTVRMEADDEAALEASSLTARGVVPARSVPFGVPGVCWVVFDRAPGDYPTASFACDLKFLLKEVNPSTGQPNPGDEGDEDEYPLEALDLDTADYVRGTPLPNWKEEWERHGDAHEDKQVFQLRTMANLGEAVSEIMTFLGLAACDRTDAVPANKKRHILCLAGVFNGSYPVLVRARMRLEQSGGVSVELVARSGDSQVSNLVVNAI